MERLLADASKLSGQKYDISNLSDVYDAIHVIQDELGVTGTTAKEAATTFTGSFSAMASAAKNVLGSLTLGEDVTPALTALAESVMTFAQNNLLPMAENIIKSLPSVISNLLQSIGPQIVPMGVEILTALVDGLAEGLPELLASVGELIPVIVVQIVKSLPQIIAAGVKIWKSLLEGMKSYYGALFGKIGEMLAPIVEKITTFGKNLVQGLWNGIKDTTQWLIDKIKGFTQTALDAVKDFFGIHSPSKETAWMGEMLNRGLAQGITGSIGIVERAMGDVASVTLGEINPTTYGEISATANSNADVISAISRVESLLSGVGIYLDGDTLVGGIQSRVDDALGQNTRNSNRLALA